MPNTIFPVFNKTLSLKYFLALVLILIQLSANGQQKDLGNRKQFVEKLKSSATTNSSQNLLLDLGSGIKIKSTVKIFTKESTTLFTGKILSPFEGEISIMNDSLGKLSGHVIFKKQRIAFKIEADSLNSIISIPTPIEQVLCIDFANNQVLPEEIVPILALDDTPDAYKLQSYSSAVAVAYLDFDGERVSETSWLNGSTINAPRRNFSQAEMKRIWRMVSEDYMPFKINITTDRAIYDSAPRGRRTQCIFTSEDTVAPKAGGVAFVGSFRSTATISNPCWVFNATVKSAGEAASHEIGHTLGLKHDGTSTPDESYYNGHANWAPIMGSGYTKNLVQWSKGEYSSPTSIEDDLAIISGRNNGFGYKTDDHGNIVANATLLTIETNGTVLSSKNEGIIETRTDKDFFTFTTNGGLVNLLLKPAIQDANLDISFKILDEKNIVVGSYTKTGTGLDASFSQNLNAGKYFLEIDGTGDGNATSTGYSDYGSIGFFSISGTIPQKEPNTILVAITSPSMNSNFIEGTPIELKASATNNTNTIAKVEFYNGTIKLGEDLIAPFTYILTNTTAGTYMISAIAYDKAGNKSQSSEVSIIVGKDQDKDGVIDAIDNCATTYNPDQADANQDGYGDACNALIAGTDDIFKKPEFNVVPNPFEREAVINIPTPKLSTIRIYDNVGRLVEEIVTDKNVPVPVTLKSGIYQIVLIVDNITYHKMVIKD